MSEVELPKSVNRQLSYRLSLKVNSIKMSMNESSVSKGTKHARGTVYEQSNKFFLFNGGSLKTD